MVSYRLITLPLDCLRHICTSITLRKVITPYFPQCNYAPHVRLHHIGTSVRLRKASVKTHTKISKKAMPSVPTKPNVPRLKATRPNLQKVFAIPINWIEWVREPQNLLRKDDLLGFTCHHCLLCGSGCFEPRRCQNMCVCVYGSKKCLRALIATRLRASRWWQKRMTWRWRSHLLPCEGRWCC